MHISKLYLINYRNFSNACLHFRKGANTIIGENGSGKTNLFRAIRLLLDDHMIRAAYRLEQGDFHRGLGDWRGHWIIIGVDFDDVSDDEVAQSLLLHGTGDLEDDAIRSASYNLVFRPNRNIRSKFAGLSRGDRAGFESIRDTIEISDYETIFTGRSEANLSNPDTYRKLAGDFDRVIFTRESDLPPLVGAQLPKMLSVAKEVSFTHVQALRDVVADFRNNRTNPLLHLLRRSSGNIDPASLEPINKTVGELNKKIANLTEVRNVRKGITTTIREAAGDAYSPAAIEVSSGLPTEADRLFQALKLEIDESDGEEPEYLGSIHELSLGGANLIYLTLKLLEFKYRKEDQPIANFLLVEEPEAHIHTHIQKTLFDRLGYTDTQVIFSTHSTHISEVSAVRAVNVLARKATECEVYQPSNGLSEDRLRKIQRYLDAVRSNLLFAKSVILVEGDAEEILIPTMVKMLLGMSLDELGISLINIRSTGFQNIADLFHDDRIRKRCGILTDLDRSLGVNKSALEPEAQKQGAARKEALERFTCGNQWVESFFTDHTFEVDLVASGNVDTIVRVIPDVYTHEAKITTAAQELRSDDLAIFGKRILAMATYAKKGWFALLLAEHVDHGISIPKYIRDALFFAHPALGEGEKTLWAKILSYRLDKERVSRPDADLRDLEMRIASLETGEIDFCEVQSEFARICPSDAILSFMKAVCVSSPCPVLTPRLTTFSRRRSKNRAAIRRFSTQSFAALEMGSGGTKSWGSSTAPGVSRAVCMAART